MEKDLVDYRKINADNLNTPEVQEILVPMFKRWIRDSEDIMSSEGMIQRWDKCDLYREGHQVPAGFTNSALANFVRHNSERFREANRENDMLIDDNNQIYFVDNKVGDIYNEMLGEYTEVKRVTQIMHDANPRNNGLEKALSKIFDKIEKRRQLWDTVRMPCIENMLLYGTAWSRINYNPRRNYPYGEIEFEVIHPKDVLFGRSRAKYYADTKYRIWKQYVELSDARRYLYDNFGIDPSEVSPDEGNREPDERYQDSQDDKRSLESHVTFYHVELVQVYSNPLLDDKTKKLVREERAHYFSSMYLKQFGALTFVENKNTYCNQHYDKFYLTPYVDIQSKARQYAISTIEQLLNIQDFINITKSLLLDNARQRNIVRAVVKKEIIDSNPDLWEAFLRYGDPLPLDEEIDINRAIKFVEIPSLPKEVYEFLSIAEQSLQRQAVSRDVLRGEYPSNELSGTAIKQIKSEARRRLSYKDVNISWSATQEACKMYNIIANEFSEEDFVNLTDTSKQDKNNVIVYNSIKLLPDYLKFLQDNELDQKQFEANNEVEFIENANKNLESFDTEIANNAISEARKYMEINPEIDPNLKGNPEAVKGVANLFARMRTTMVFINVLSPKDEMNIRVDLDFDAERRKDIDRQTSIWLFGQGEYPLEMLLEDLGGHFADNAERIINIQKQYKLALQLQEQIESRGPEFMNAVGQLMAMFDQRQNAMQSQMPSKGPVKNDAQKSQPKQNSKPKEIQ